MNHRHLGRTGIAVSEVYLGTMTFGGMADDATALACLDKAFDAGVDFIGLYRTHWPDPHVPIEATLDPLGAVEQLPKEIRHPME